MMRSIWLLQFSTDPLVSTTKSARDCFSVFRKLPRNHRLELGLRHSSTPQHPLALNLWRRRDDDDGIDSSSRPRFEEERNFKDRHRRAM